MKTLDPQNIPLAGLNLIEASAGTGKTYTITTLFHRMIVEQGLTVDQILVVTFTEAATAELRDRIRTRLYDELVSLDDADDDVSRRARGAVSRALESFDEAAIFTIHGFCQRVLHDSAFECNVPFDTDLEPDMAPVIAEVVGDFWAREAYGAEPVYCRFLEANAGRSDLEELAKRAAEHRDSRVLSPTPPPTDDAAEQRFADAFGEARALWESNKDAVSKIFFESKVLNRGRLKKKSMPGLLASVAALFSPEAPRSVGLSKNFDRFTPAYLKVATRKGLVPPGNPFFDACERLLAAAEALKSAYGARVAALKLELVDTIRAELPVRKDARGIQSFDDLLWNVDQALRGQFGGRLAARLNGRYRAALIDEFQDTDPVQYRIFSRIYQESDAALFLIGDPKQAIYGFRGADIFAYLRAAKDAQSSAHTLDTNWRSDPSLVKGVNRLFKVEQPFVYDDITFPKVCAKPDALDRLMIGGERRPPVQLRLVSSEGRTGSNGKNIIKGNASRDLPGLVAGDIRRLLDGGATIDVVASGDGGPPEPPRSVRPGDIAVLVRRNFEAADTQVALQEIGIRSVVQSTGNVFESQEAVQMSQMLEAVADPGDRSKLKAALSTDLFGLSGNQIYAVERDDQSWAAWIQRFRDWRDQWTEHGFVQMFRAQLVAVSMAGGTTAQVRILSRPDGERRMTNLLHLAELLHTAARDEQLGVQGLIRWLWRNRTGSGLRADATELRLESDDDAVKLVTIHKSKGLEYPIVYCPYLWDGGGLHTNDKKYLRFHNPDRGDALEIDIGSEDLPEHMALALRELRSENLRLAYVAMTRAKHMCVVLWGRFATSEDSALGYLLHNQGGDDPIGATAAYIEQLSDSTMLEAMEAVAADSGGAIEASMLDEGPVERFSGAGDVGADFAARSARRRMRNDFRTSSYSGLTRGGADDERDHDLHLAATLEPVAATPPTAAPAHDAPVALVGFERSNVAGTCFHAIYEHLDFEYSQRSELEETVHKQLRVYGFDADAWTDRVSTTIEQTLDTPLSDEDPGFILRGISKRRRIDELEFLFPVGGGRRSSQTQPLSPTRLGTVFSTHASTPTLRNYGAALERLGFSSFRGFLRGFVDLIFERDSKWYVADYKSNHLGDRLSGYHRPLLDAQMVRHHYVLQYHLYVLALHRHLGRCLRDYDYETHFGGVFYLFIKGMSAATGPSCGVYRDRPPAALIEGLDQLFGQLEGDR